MTHDGAQNEVEIGDYGLVFFTDDRGRQVIGEYDDDILACEVDPKFANTGACRMCPMTSEPCPVDDNANETERPGVECCGQLMVIVGPDGERLCEQYEVKPIPAKRLPMLRCSNGRVVSGVAGVYCVQLLPEIAPYRLKFGFTSNFAQRLRILRTSCPNARLVSTWDGDARAENALLGHLRAAANSETWIRWTGGEIFDAMDELDRVLAKVNSFITGISENRRGFAEVRKIVDARKLPTGEESS
jgi:hypothetical protein